MCDNEDGYFIERPTHSWIVEMLEMVKVADNVKGLFSGSMSVWKALLPSKVEGFGKVGIKNLCGLQGDSLSPLLFILVMIPLTMLLKRENIGHKIAKDCRLINHLLFMDNLKLYGR